MNWSKKIKLHFDKATKKYQKAKKAYLKAKSKGAKKKQLIKLWKACKLTMYNKKAWKQLLDWAKEQNRVQEKIKKKKQKSSKAKTKNKTKTKSKKGTAKSDKSDVRKLKAVKSKPTTGMAKKETDTVVATPAPPPNTQSAPEPKPSVRKKTPTPVKTIKPEPSGNVKDNLKRIEGIGPKIEQLLNLAGITTWSALAGSRVSTLRKILADAGPRFRMHNPSSWARQARLAAQGKWEQLKKLQEDLKGGK